jgi:PTH1 family peptidyl-tRNA hydrolase
MNATPAEMIVILGRDGDLPWGMIAGSRKWQRRRTQRLKSVIGAVGTTEFLRVRMGVQPEHQLGDLADYVLGPMNASQRQAADDDDRFDVRSDRDWF